VLNPLVSVVMAVYNGERYLKPTIESTLNQTFKNFEFVIVNDASTDRTMEIINSYDDPRIKLYNNEKNIGQTKSLNVGLNAAKGKYIARIDAGDVSMPERLEKQLAFMEKNKEVSVLGTSAFRYDESGRIIDVVHMPKSPKGRLQRIFFASPLVHISVLMKRDIIENIGGYNEEYDVLADYELWSRLTKKGYGLSNLKQILAGYLVSPESFGSKHSMGKSLLEASRIIESNVNTLTSLSISLKEATQLYKFLALNMYEMTMEDILNAEKLFINIFYDINASKREINYLLVRKYLKHIIHYMKEPSDKLTLIYSIKTVCKKVGYIISYERFVDILQQLHSSILWKRKKLPFKYV
jgi:glycosyltransferase involved in cell wall biosynthesis